MIARKLHLRRMPPSNGIASHFGLVDVCRLSEYRRPPKLLSSRDGVVAFETTRPGDERAEWCWRSRACLPIELGPPTFQAAARAARAAWDAFAEPDVELIVVELSGLSVPIPTCATLVRGRGEALWVPTRRRSTFALRRPLSE